MVDLHAQHAQPSAPTPQVIHEFDGIEELDNNLPTWWLWTFLGAIAFAAFYWVHYEVLRTGASPIQAYRAELAQAEAERAKAGPPVSAELLVGLAKDASAVTKGKEAFATNCVACHGPGGGGGIGPNLTDEYWLHGGAPERIYHTVVEGVQAKGMPAWGPILGEEKTRAVVAYLLTLHNTHVEGGKAPQGEKE